MWPQESMIHRGRRLLRVASLLWLLLLCWPLAVFLGEGPGPAEIAWALAASAGLACCWLRINWRALSVLGMPLLPWELAGLCAAVLALFPVLGHRWAYCSFLFVVSALAMLPGWVFHAGVAATAAVEVSALLVFGVPVADFWWVPVLVVVQATVVRALLGMGRLVHELAAARAEVARLAVDNERLRFARDLHDILGHTLTSITIRSQLAARLARRDAERAAAEMTVVEHTARRALDEVRDAVAGYRALSLPDELDNARHALGGAGISCEVAPPGDPVPVLAESLLAWAVREGTTNVLRHSGAGRCAISVRVDPAQASVEVRDDGPRTSRPADAAGGPEPGRRGNGLTGLAERVAVAGGTLDAGPLPGGGYRLLARIPLEAR
ncbi:hypothetical protein Misp01_11220 [Microtetraspora sp. NBRC 13810]|uniref:sensor histidine kinase n=1 Tax=Microtetraspora sp. NBRC 13810 TaxID=3030990 RepID=UPI00249FA52D|nr:histidine kinase [Microtetraspora sp. NBRC 13810]GLW05992.1 hypothetical protein Misp01_11220 [Microtetraspora sp. NBRC 13810]